MFAKFTSMGKIFVGRSMTSWVIFIVFLHCINSFLNEIHINFVKLFLIGLLEYHHGTTINFIILVIKFYDDGHIFTQID